MSVSYVDVMYVSYCDLKIIQFYEECTVSEISPTVKDMWRICLDNLRQGLYFGIKIHTVHKSISWLINIAFQLKLNFDCRTKMEMEE